MKLHNMDIDHLSSVLPPSAEATVRARLSLHCTATLAIQLELEVVVVVGAKTVNAANPIEHANTPNVYKGTGCN